MIFGLTVTLTCPDCGADCPMESPFNGAAAFGTLAAPPTQSIPEQISANILEAAKTHKIAGCPRKL